LVNNSTGNTQELYEAPGYDVDSFLDKSVSVTSGDSYSIWFKYTGEYDYGVSIDDILVTEEQAYEAPVEPDYVFCLEDGQEAAGKVLTSDDDGNATWLPSANAQELSISGNQLSITNGNSVFLPSGGGGSYNFTNGLTEAGSNVKLGGIISEVTSIKLGQFDNLTIEAENTSDTTPGKFILKGNNRSIMSTNFKENYVQFGTEALTPLNSDGTTLEDSGGTDYTIDFVAGFHANNANGGTAIKTGSVEYMVDGNSEMYFSHNLNPIKGFNLDLGSAGLYPRRWWTLHTTNAVNTSSDINLKKNIKKLSYGLNEIMKLETITYNWKDNTRGKTKIPRNLQERKIGFSAQQLLTVLPETVSTHSWIPKDEKGNYERVENKYLGVFYSDVIPVAVKAIQEQQEIIEAQNDKLEKLEAQILALKNMVNTLISTQN
jgi:hypothetical protein